MEICVLSRNRHHKYITQLYNKNLNHNTEHKVMVNNFIFNDDNNLTNYYR